MAEHDHSYKLLFSHPEMVRDLLDGFVREDWLAQLDYASLERVSCHYVTDDLRARADDVVWRVRWGEDWVYIYLLIEFQSTIERYMAVRILTYVGLLYQDLIRAGQLVEGKLPPVLPIVLYNGARRWNAAEELSELMQPGPRALEPYLPRVRYLLIDERRYRDSELAPLRNLVAALFRLEISRTRSDIEEILRALHQWLSSAEQLSLRRAFAARSRGLILTRFPSVETAKMDELEEVYVEVVNRFDAWEAEIKQKTEAHLLLRLLRKRFGELPELVTARVNGAPADQIEDWSEKLLDAASIDALFDESALTA